jgi:hypothetical protein
MPKNPRKKAVQTVGLIPDVFETPNRVNVAQPTIFT